MRRGARPVFIVWEARQGHSTRRHDRRCGVRQRERCAGDEARLSRSTRARLRRLARRNQYDSPVPHVGFQSRMSWGPRRRRSLAQEGPTLDRVAQARSTPKALPASAPVPLPRELQRAAAERDEGPRVRTRSAPASCRTDILCRGGFPAPMRCLGPPFPVDGPCRVKVGAVRPRSPEWSPAVGWLPNWPAD